MNNESDVVLVFQELLPLLTDAYLKIKKGIYSEHLA
jgi:hypothetical protein